MKTQTRNALGYLGLVTLLASCSSHDPRVGQEQTLRDLTLVSQNVHYYIPDRDNTDWVHRRHALTAALKELAPDIILFQEMETFQGREETSANLQRDWVLETVPGYQAGANAAEATQFPITQPIFFKTEKFELVDQGFFFFSPTPDQIYSRTWEGHYPSFTSWVLLRQKANDQKLYVYNTHPEAFSNDTLDRGTRLVRDRIRNRAFPEVPVILAGDFNMLSGDAKLTVLKDAKLTRAPTDATSFHFQAGLHLYSAIDHFFATPELIWAFGGAVQKKWEGFWTSDHYPVLAAYQWRAPDRGPGRKE